MTLIGKPSNPSVPWPIAIRVSAKFPKTGFRTEHRVRSITEIRVTVCHKAVYRNRILFIIHYTRIYHLNLVSGIYAHCTEYKVLGLVLAKSTVEYSLIVRVRYGKNSKDLNWPNRI